MGGTPKEYKETLGGDEYIYYLDFDDGFMYIYTYMSKFVKIHTLCAAYCMPTTSQ